MDAHKRLGLESSLLSRLWQSSPENMFILRVEKDAFYVVSLNTAAQQAWNTKPGAVAGMKLTDVVAKDVVEQLLPFYHQCVERCQSLHYEQSESFSSDDGRERHWSTQLSPILNDQGGVEYIFGITRNITELKNARREAEQAAYNAEQANRIKTAFLANMSHEMRTPLNGIQCAMELLRDCDSQREREELYEIVVNATEALTRQTNDILEYAKLGSGTLKLEQENFSPTQVHREVYQLLHKTAADKNIEFSFHIDSAVPRYLCGDAGRLKQILLNLAGNAIKFTHSGLVAMDMRLVTKADEIAALRLNEQDVLLQFQIRDTGIGIDENDMKKLFHPFSQLDDSNRQHEGSGLGLAISKNLIELMGGRISVDSRPQKGSVFTVEIPFPRSDSQTEVADLSFAPVLAGFSILLVEDNPTNQLAMQRILQRYGAEVLVADHGEQALRQCQKWRQQEKRFDLILMDWHMPVMDGLRTTAVLREDPYYQDVVIIGLTANVLEEDRQSCLLVGMNDVVPKPVDRRRLISCIRQQLLSHSQAV